MICLALAGTIASVQSSDIDLNLDSLSPSLPLSWQVEGKPADNLTQPEVVQLLRQSEGSVTVLISRQEVIEKREEEVRGSRYMYMYIPFFQIAKVQWCRSYKLPRPLAVYSGWQGRSTYMF